MAAHIVLVVLLAPFAILPFVGVWLDKRNADLKTGIRIEKYDNVGDILKRQK